MTFYIYENWQAGPRKAVIHHGSCGHCKDGRGRSEGFDPTHASWHGPFVDLVEVRCFQQSMNVAVRKQDACVAKHV